MIMLVSFLKTVASVNSNFHVNSEPFGVKTIYTLSIVVVVVLLKS